MEHTVEQGEHLARIAEAYGFPDPRTLWEHPKNLSLKLKRETPHVLSPGDVIHIPDADSDGAYPVETGHSYTFVLQRSAPQLRIALRGLDGKAMAGASVSLAIDGKERDLTADGSGLVEAALPAGTEGATLTVGELAVALLVGFLDPIDQRSGVEARLSNLGYYTGAVGAEDDDQFRFALQLFQAAEGLRVTGENDTATRARLKDDYGS
jgi:hypothetical protein